MQKSWAVITRTGKAATSGCRLASFYSQGGRNLPWFKISLETTQGAWGKPERGRRSRRGESILSPGREGGSSEPAGPHSGPNPSPHPKPHTGPHAAPLPPLTPNTHCCHTGGGCRNQFGEEREALFPSLNALPLTQFPVQRRGDPAWPAATVLSSARPCPEIHSSALQLSAAQPLRPSPLLQ